MVWGTAVLIAPGVALTAAHVLVEHERVGHFKNGSLLAIGVNQNEIEFWVANTMTVVGDTDLAVLSLEPRSSFEHGAIVRATEASLHSPGVGDIVTVVGFVASHVSFENGEPIGLNAVQSTGAVLDLFETGRDSIYPGPCFSADMATINGMSGGPVLNSEGRLIGVLSGGLGDSYSMISLIRNATAAPLTVSWPPNFYPKGVELRSSQGALIRDKDRFNVYIDPETSERRWEYIVS